jgi:energy-coupling factor transporter transmembrane protein EcfT
MQLILLYSFAATFSSFWMIFGLVTIFFFAIPIYLSIKYPIVRLAYGVILMLVGFLLVFFFWWFAGVGIVLGGPPLIMGIAFTISGYNSTRNHKEKTDSKIDIKRMTNHSAVENDSSDNSLNTDAADRLKKLKELLDIGALSQEEYNEKKKKLLDKI